MVFRVLRASNLLYKLAAQFRLRVLVSFMIFYQCIEIERFFELLERYVLLLLLMLCTDKL